MNGCNNLMIWTETVNAILYGSTLLALFCCPINQMVQILQQRYRILWSSYVVLNIVNEKPTFIETNEIETPLNW